MRRAMRVAPSYAFMAACLGIALRMAIAGNMVAPVENIDLMARNGEFATDNGTGKPGTDNGYLLGLGRHRPAL